MANSPPDGYLNRKVAQSVQEAVQSYTVDHIKTIVKSGIQRYIESFMSPVGGNRSLYETVTKMGLQYIVDKSFDPTTDPTLRKTQLARLFEQIHRELPAILIVDSAFEYVPTNFTGIERAHILQGSWYGTLQIVRQLSILVVAGTRDQSSTDFLHGLLSVLFGELRFLAGGNLITGNRDLGETWVMTLGSPKLGTVSQDNVSDDPKDKIWTFSIEIPDIIFEDTVKVKQAVDKIGGQGVGSVSPRDYIADTPPTIIAPETIAINDSVKVYFETFQPEFHRVIISDPNIATYEPQSQILTPRKLGTFQLQVIRHTTAPLNAGNFNQQSGALFDVVSFKEIRVLPA
jgi:hypothetical protein